MVCERAKDGVYRRGEDKQKLNVHCSFFIDELEAANSNKRLKRVALLSSDASAPSGEIVRLVIFLSLSFLKAQIILILLQFSTS